MIRSMQCHTEELTIGKYKEDTHHESHHVYTLYDALWSPSFVGNGTFRVIHSPALTELQSMRKRWTALLCCSLRDITRIRPPVPIKGEHDV